MTTNTGSLSAKNVWGKIVLFLKEHRKVALHVACGDITDVEIKGNQLIINVYDGMLVELLQDGKQEIYRALNWQGLELEIVINVKVLEQKDTEKDIQKLKDVFGDYLKVKGGL